MVWRCPKCLAEWQGDDIRKCPRCHTNDVAPQPTYGIYFPLIEAMQMIDDGEDPRHGRIGARLDLLMEEQMAAVGAKRVAPAARQGRSDGLGRVIVMDPEDPVTCKESGAIYLTVCELTRADVGAKCSLCKMPVRPNTRNVRLECGDLFHSNCISRHLKTGRPQCPNCKALVK
jgi:hypothetical protein